MLSINEYSNDIERSNEGPNAEKRVRFFEIDCFHSFKNVWVAVSFALKLKWIHYSYVGNISMINK